MGVEYFACTYCGEVFDDCNQGYWCDCREQYCSKECADGKEISHSEKFNKITCRICRQEYQSDYVLLEFLLEKCLLSREGATKMYWETVNSKKQK